MCIHDKINARARSRTDRRKNTSATAHIPGVLKALEGGQIPYRVIGAESEESAALTEWTERMFPFIHSQVDWSRIPSHQCVTWSGLEDLVLEFERFSRQLTPESLVMVMWADALCPVLEMNLAGVVRIAREIFEEHETST
ncbi:MAG TPA: hypothetical protein DEH78_19745, partial [Solibacterales bacterium]|nr:hypothetical protein [Bryobacterales bacterium]